jgi:hypothetical protein
LSTQVQGGGCPSWVNRVTLTLRQSHLRDGRHVSKVPEADKLRVAPVKFDAHFLVLLSQWKFSNEVLLLQRNLVKSYPILRHQIEKFARGTF